jgi:hypothetical protein
MFDVLPYPASASYPITVEVNGACYRLTRYFEQIQAPNGLVVNSTFQCHDGGLLYGKIQRDRITLISVSDFFTQPVNKWIYKFLLPLTIVCRDTGQMLNVMVTPSSTVRTIRALDVSTGNEEFIGFYDIGFDVVYQFVPCLISYKSLEKAKCTCGGVATYGNTMDCSRWCDLVKIQTSTFKGE